ncbi:MAG TPA: amidohydrolase [Herpetosiphonaceae bacterium]
MPDLLFHGGAIYTLDPQQPQVEALLVRDDTIVAAGAAAEVREHLRPGYEDIALGGRAVVPGLTDAHIHLLWTGIHSQNVNLDGVRSLDEALEMIRRHAEQLPEGAWLRGHGWNHALWEYRWPTAVELDRVTQGHPAILSRKDGHSVWANSQALTIAGIDDRTPDPDGGLIQRDELGQPTGILLENANDLIYSVVPEPSLAENVQALRRIIRACNQRGLTSLHMPEGSSTLAALQVLYGAGQLDARCLYHLPYRQLDDYIALGVRSGFGDEWLRIGGVKIFSDGSLGSCTCHMLSPFAGSTSNYGIPTIPEEELYDAVRKANTNGISVAVHAIGDRANRTVLDAIAAQEQAFVAIGEDVIKPVLRNRIEHAQHLDPADVPRFAALGVIASMQPVHATSDIDIAERLLGDERCCWSYAWQPLRQSGAVLAFGSDAPVETLDPWAGIHAAVTRKRQDGQPPDGWHRELALSLDAALWSYVVGPAIASGETALKGPLTPGLRADLVVLNADPYQSNPDDLWQMEVAQTFVGGRSVWEER